MMFWQACTEDSFAVEARMTTWGLGPLLSHALRGQQLELAAVLASLTR